MTSDVWPEVQATLFHTTDRIITKADYENGYCLHHDRLGKVFGYPMRNPRENDMPRSIQYNYSAE